MKLFQFLLILGIFVMGAACSTNDSTDAGDDDSVESLVDDDDDDSDEDDELSDDDDGELAMDSEDEDGDDELLVDGDEDDDEAIEEISDDSVAASEDENFNNEMAEAAPEEEAFEEQNAEAGAIAQYVVKPHDTLMFIAFKVFGNHMKWRELLSVNDNISGESLAVGSTINYRVPAVKFRWNKNGNPFLIRVGDTLGTISGEVYGVQGRWNEIYNNNRQMIHDPNLIFAGFTLYYVPDRELASE